MGTQGLGSSVWCVKSCARAIAALKKFSMKRDFIADRQYVLTRHGLVERLCLSPMISYCGAAEAQAVKMHTALHRWANLSQKR